MKLTRLKVEQLRQFREPLEICDLEEGINLFVGPNESGKSTLVRAIRAAFFERHKSSSVDDLQPWGDSAAAPQVELDFHWQGQRWSLTKSFLKKKRADLQVDGESWSGEEAEDKLAALLGFEFAGRGASRPENWGIPGLLWIEQGAGQDLAKPVEHAGQHLKAALGGHLGEVTSSSGDALIKRVDAERRGLLTGTGRPTGDYARAISERDALAEQYQALQARIQEYRQQVDRLGQLRQEQARDEAERPWEVFRRQAREAQERLDEVSGWMREQDRDAQTLEGFNANLKAHIDLLQGFEDRQHELSQRAQARDQAQQQLADIEARQPQSEQALEQARSDFEAAKAALRQAREQQQRSDIVMELEQLDAERASLETSLTRARELQASLLAHRQASQASPIDQATLLRLKEVEQALAALAIRQDALATRLRFDLQGSQAVTLGGEPLTGQGERLLLEPGEISIAGVGSLRILPGGTDIGDLVRSREQLQDEQASLRRRLGVASLQEAEQQQVQQREAEQTIQHTLTLLEQVAPQGIEDLIARQQALATRQQRLAEHLQALPEAEEETVPIGRAEAQLEAARETLSGAETARNELVNRLQLARLTLDTARNEWQRLQADLQAPDRQQREQQARAQLLELRARAEQLSQTMAQRQQQIDQANPDILRQDQERLSRSAETAERAAENRRLQRASLQASLEAMGAEGLEEKSAELEAELERAHRRHDQLQLRADALSLLLERLTAHRLALTRQLQAPLQQHLNRYLQLLFPGASLSVDEDLMPRQLLRGPAGAEERSPFDDLSFGAREQMALISRLAYADLLKEAGRATLIILDDALVHSDAARLQAMKRVLFDAAQRHQILLFSCHPDNWRDLGVGAREMGRP